MRFKPVLLSCFFIGLLSLIVLIPAKSGVAEAYWNSFVARGSSMEPTLQEGDRFMVDLDWYKSHRPRRGDIALFSMKDYPGKYIKRIIGLPGEKVEFRGDKLFINGRLCPEPWNVISTSLSDNFEPVLIPKDSVYLVGDNRDCSLDSRIVGPIKMNRLSGKLIFVYWSKNFKKIGKTQ